MMEQIPMFVIELLKHYAKAVQLPEQELAAISDRWVMPQAKMFDKEQYDIVQKDAEVGKIYLPWLNKSNSIWTTTQPHHNIYSRSQRMERMENN